MAVDGMALVGEAGPEIVFLPPGARVVMTEMAKTVLFGPRVTPVITVGHIDDVGISFQFGPSPPPDTGDLFFDDDSGSLSVWNGIAWDEIRPPDVAAACPCPYCGTLNPLDAAECGAGRWNGCGGPLEVQ